MMSRRVRRDSETSTDSWSLVEEDRLDDDFSLNSTDNEGVELETEPIIEEPPTSDEDTASEKSMDSDEDSELSDEESEISENEEEEEEDQEIHVESEEDSDLSENSESEDSESDEDEDIDDVASEVSEIMQMNDEELAEAAAKLKEDEKWMDNELEEMRARDARTTFRIFLVFSAFVLIFPVADFCTSWMLTYRSHSFSPKKVDYMDQFIFENIGSQQSYHSKHDIPQVFEKLTEEQLEEAWKEEKVTKKSPDNFYKLRDIIVKTAVKEHEIRDIFTRQSQNWKQQTDIDRIPRVNKTTVIPMWQSYSKYYASKQITPSYRNPRETWHKANYSYATCRALAPVPPAPFSPRRIQKKQIPRHQPCLVHVNQSKWTCQKNLPAVIYETTPNYTVMPRTWKKKAMGRTGIQFPKRKIQKFDVCGKKASQSMRTIPKPTDQCHSRHFSKFTPRRKHIAYKAPLPCKVPTYKPSIPRPRPTVTPTVRDEKTNQLILNVVF